MATISPELRDRDLKEIPSELIEPYLVAMLSVELENIAYNPTQKQLEEAKNNLRGVERFVMRFCGIHSRYATMNIYYNFYDMTLEQAIKINEATDKQNNG